MFTVDFFERDFTEKINYPPELIEVDNYSFSAVGGPDRATFTAKGTAVQLWQFAEMIRCPIVIHDDNGRKVWWGYIERADITVDGVRRSVTLRDTVNNVYVAYTENGERKTTAVASDSDSETEFGKIERKFTLDDVTSAEAEQYRDAILAQKKYPSVSEPIPAGTSENIATIKCRGWWNTLDWQYFNTDVGLVEYVDIDSFPGRELGRDTRMYIAQSFQQKSGETWSADKVWVRAMKVVGTSIADDLEIHIYSDSGGSPNASLASGSYTGSSLNTYFEWIEISLSSAVSLSDSTTYWIVAKRSDAPNVDINDYFRLDGNSFEGYTDGDFKMYNNDAGSWRGYVRPLDLNFRVTQEKSTTTQISDIISECGAFILETDILDASGLDSVPAKDGDTSARWETERILRKGTSNNRRLLARVRENYHAEIYEEEPKGQSDYYYREGVIQDEYGAILPPQVCPVGMWIKFADMIPDYVNKTRLSNAGFAFVEEAEYNVRDRSYRIKETRDITKFKELFETQDG